MMIHYILAAFHMTLLIWHTEKQTTIHKMVFWKWLFHRLVAKKSSATDTREEHNILMEKSWLYKHMDNNVFLQKDSGLQGTQGSHERLKIIMFKPLYCSQQYSRSTTTEVNNLFMSYEENPLKCIFVVFFYILTVPV